MAADELQLAVSRLCLAFPQTERIVSHGSPNFRLRGGKVFATYALNHHGDGRIALWLNVPGGMQDEYVSSDPRHYFVPPYVGPSGWLGVRLDQGLAWKQVGQLVRAAYLKVAPPALGAKLGATPTVPAPRRKLKVADLDPQRTARGQRILAAMRSICLALPETSEGLQFGQPVWRAGKRVFAQAYCYDARWRAAFWVGIEQQGLMTADQRYEIPPYLGPNGWIALDVTKSHNERELRSLAEYSYRHFALQRMLRSLDC